jgi:hypothetical protein
MKYQEIYEKIRAIVAEQKQVAIKEVSLDSLLLEGQSTQNLPQTSQKGFGFFSFLDGLSSVPYDFNTEKSDKDPNWKFSGSSEAKHTTPNFAGFGDFIDLDEMQKVLLRKKLMEYIPALAAAGVGVGSVFGPIGAAISGVVGAGIGFVASIFS